MIFNTGLEAIISGIVAVSAAQWIKFFSSLYKTKKVNFKVLTETGGMPSSHSSAVVALTTSVGLIAGFNSLLFAVSLGYGLVVMYDAAGLRRSAGRMAVVLNRVVADFYRQNKNSHATEKLIELLGHTPFEVLMGAMLGSAVSLSFHYFLMG